MPEQKNGDYEVGYKRPPEQSRFRPGQSGNPKGRPPCRKTEAIDVGAVMNEPMTVLKAGRPKIMSGFEVGIRKLLARALKDRHLASAVEFLRLCERYGVVGQRQPEGPGGVLVVPKDWPFQEWLELYRRFGPPPWPGEKSGVPGEGPVKYARSKDGKE